MIPTRMILGAFLFGLIVNAQSVDEGRVRAKIVSFVQKEFDGENDVRIDMASYNSVVVNSENNLGNRENRIISFDHSTIHVVKGFRIKSLERVGDAWRASVEFDELSTIYGDEPNRKLENKPIKETVGYRLVKRKADWRIFEPAEPRISVESLKRWFARAIKLDDARQNSAGILNKPSKMTIEYRHAMLEALGNLHE